MNKVTFVNDRQECQRGYQLPDGRIVVVVNTKGEFEIRYDTPFNVESGEIGESENATTLNDLYASGIGKDVYCYDEYYIEIEGDCGTVELTEDDVESICAEFEQSGFNVTPEAVWHNYDAWCGDLKSGYRDEENGYHLFTPCGCNPLSFNATTLNDNCDWQKTYEC